MDGQTTFLTEAEQDAAAERRYQLEIMSLSRRLTELLKAAEITRKWPASADVARLAEILLDVLGSSEDVYAIEQVLAGEVTE